jgi:hypothetical protein
MRGWIIRIFAVLLVVAGLSGYAAYWKIVHDRALALLDEQVVVWRTQGYDVAWTSRTSGGFPFTVEAVFADARIANPVADEPWSWAGETLRVHLRPWDWTEIAIEPKGRQSAVTTRSGEVGAEARDFVVRLRADSVGLRTLTVTGRDAGVVTRAGATLAAADSLAAHAERDAEDPGRYRVVGEIAGAQWSGATAGAPQLISLDADIGALDRLAAEGDLSAAALTAWAAAGGGLMVHDLRADWGDAAIGARGDLTLDRAGHWNGQVELDSRAPSRAFAHLASMGAIDAQAAAQAGAVADAMVRQGEQSVRLVFDVRQGEVYLLGLRLGRLAPAF